MFGGFGKTKTGNYYKSKIVRFDPIKNSWTTLGYLKVARAGLGVIKVDNEFIVVGGGQVRKTETCKLNEQSMMICTKREPPLVKFEHYPELMLIS